MSEVILVTDVEYEKGKDAFEQASGGDLDLRSAPHDEAALSEAVQAAGARAVIIGGERYVGPLYEALPRGGVIARFGVGHDAVDKERATRAGLAVTITPGTMEDSVAEHAMWMMGALGRTIPTFDRSIRKKRWDVSLGIEFREKRLAVLGCGEIGRRVGRIASRGFGMTVTGFDCRPQAGQALVAEWGFSDYTADLATALRSADVVTIHLPGAADTRHLLNREALSLMKTGSLLVNTARGSIVDESALYDALSEERLAGAALDVFEAEPYTPADPARDLRTLPNVLLTPHVAGTTREGCRRMAERAIANVVAGLARRYDEMDLLNPQVVDRD